MATLIIQEKGVARTRPAVNGEEITIAAPCNCTEVTGVQIAGVKYPFYDACGNNVSNIAGKFSEGSLIRLLIDTTNTRAQIINQASASITNETKALFGLGADAVPDDVFGWLGKYNQHYWKRRINTSHYVPDTYDLVETANVNRGNSKTEYGIQYSEELDINQGTGEFDLLNPQSVSVGYNSPTSANVLKGKYFKPMDYGTPQSIRFAPKTAADAVAVLDSNKYCVRLASYAVRTAFVSETGEWEYLRSSDRAAYPDSGVVNDYQYLYLGVPFQNAVTGAGIVVGSYTGTGVYGEANVSTLKLPFRPLRVVIFASAGCGILRPDATSAQFETSASGGYGSNVVSFDGGTFTFTWYCNSGGSSGGSSSSNASANGQYNASGVEYSYIAFPE